jgi:chromosome segregation ATPase
MEQQLANAEHRLEIAKEEIRVLQERVAHAELGRDNVIAQKDEIQARAKTKVAHAGRIISELLGLLKPLYAAHPELEEQVTRSINTHTPPESGDIP